MKLKAKPYEHLPYVDPDDVIEKGLGWFFRYRGLALQAGIDFGILSAVKWLVKNWVFLSGVSFFLLSVFLLSWQIRRHRLQIVRLAHSFHNVTHFLRDKVTELPAALESAKKNGDFSAYNTAYKAFNAEIAARLAGFFEILIRERTVGCAIRCAERTNGKIGFSTVARAGGLWKDKREELSQPIPIDKGVARMLREKEKKGVFLVRDIKEAGKYPDIWYRTPTDDLPDAKQVMVAPINGNILGQKEMLGLLFVTTKKKDLHFKYAEHLMSFADMLGLVYPQITRYTSVH